VKRSKEEIRADDEQSHLCWTESPKSLGVLGEVCQVMDLVEEHLGTPIKPFAGSQQVDEFERMRLDPVHDDRFYSMGNRRLCGTLHVEEMRREF
jgi:hypothetical protein